MNTVTLVKMLSYRSRVSTDIIIPRIALIINLLNRANLQIVSLVRYSKYWIPGIQDSGIPGRPSNRAPCLGTPEFMSSRGHGFLWIPGPLCSRRPGLLAPAVIGSQDPGISEVVGFPV